MPATNQAGSLIAALDTVVADLRARPDIAKVTFPVGTAKVSGFAAIDQYQAYRTSLLGYQQTDTPPATGDTQGILALTAAIEQANITQIGMGQLSLDRTISPTLAAAQNKNLESLQSGLQALLAGGGTPVNPPAPKPVPEFVDLYVSDALGFGDGLFATGLSEGNSVGIQAVIEPHDPEAAAKLKWQGEFNTSTVAPDLRIVVTDTITPLGKPLRFSATLEAETRTIRLVIQPSLGDLLLVPPDPSIPDAPLVLRAATTPETPEAYAYLVWEGGYADPSGKLGPNYRLINRSDAPDLDDIPVSVGLRVN